MNRRDFIKTSLGAMAFMASGLTLAPKRASAATVDITLIAEGAQKTMVDGTTLYVWQFTDPNGKGPGVLPSGMVLLEGDTVNLTIQNNLDRPINFTVEGTSIQTPNINPGDSYLFTFTAPAAGSYVYCDTANGFIGKAMGLAGPMVVMPADGSSTLYQGGPAFDRQYTIFLQDYDDRLNAAIANGGTYNIDDYLPNYYTVNGLSYPDTKSDGDTLITMNVGENVAIRLMNGGTIIYPMHFHGYHVNVISRNRTPVTDVIDKDTPNVGVGECVDVILPVIQAGAYPLHTHYVPGVTANGVYVNPYGGGLIVMVAS